MLLRRRTGLALALAVVTAGALATAGSAAPNPPPAPETRVVKPLRGTCDLALIGPQVISAELAMTLPASVSAGQPVTPTDVVIKVVFPESAVAALTQNSVTSVSGMAGVHVLQGKVDMPVRGVVDTVAVPQSGELTVEAPGKLNVDIPATKPGKLTFTLGALELLLLPHTATADPVAGAPVTCVPEEGQDTAFATVDIVEAAGPSGPSSTSPSMPNASASPGGIRNDRRPPVAKGSAPPVHKPRALDDPADPCAVIPPDTLPIWTYYPLSGHTDVAKLKSGIDFGPGYLSALLSFWQASEDVFCGAVLGDLLWDPAQGSFTTFDFMPATSEVRVVPVTQAEGRVRDNVFNGSATVNMALSNVRVNSTSKDNGSVLDVGPKCQSAEPITLPLKSKVEEWDVFVGGTIETDFTLPGFADCRGVNGLLEPLLTGLISGPGNHLKLTFGNVVFCVDVPPNYGTKPCAPPVNDPIPPEGRAKKPGSPAKPGRR